MRTPIPTRYRPTQAASKRFPCAKSPILRTAAAIALLLIGPATVSLGAQEEPATAADARDFLGEWTLETEIQGNPIQLQLDIVDRDGQAAATLSSSANPESRTIDQLLLDGNRLVARWNADLGGQQIGLRLSLERRAETLAGQFAEQNGMFESQVTGRRRATATRSTPRPTTSSSRSRRQGNLSEIALGGGTVRVTWASQGASSTEYASFWRLEPGEVGSWTEARSIKFTTDVDLSFGSMSVPKGNVAPDYPGVYSLWPTRTAAGWGFVLNDEADIWGTMRRPAADRALVPASLETLAEPVEDFTVELRAEGDGARLLLAWGEHRLEAVFTAATSP